MSNYNAREKLSNNIEALKIIFNWDGGDPLSESELEILRGYSGFGALKAILYKTEEDWAGASEADKKLKPLYDELYDVLESNLTAKEYKRVIESVRNSTLSAFYTPTVIPDTFYQVLSRYTDVESIYDPCAGGGVFIKSAIENLPRLKKIQSYEKDLLTAKVLAAIVKNWDIQIKVNPVPFEESNDSENGQYDLICSNIPFGAVPVYDPGITDRNLTGKLHNYFFAKGIEKIKDGGVLAYLTTDAFLNSPSNKSARRYLFERCDLLSVIVMPDNLYKETAGTEAPSHLVVVRKNIGKTVLSEEEELLCETTRLSDGIVLNNYMMSKAVNGESPHIGTRKTGKNQYGKPAIETWWDGPIDGIARPLEEILVRDMRLRYKMKFAIPYKGIVEMPVGPVIDLTGEEGKYKWDTPIKEVQDTPFGKEHIIVAGIPPKQEENPFGVGEPRKEQTEEEFKYYADQYNEANWNRPITLSDILDKVKMFLPKHQQQVIVSSEENWDILKNLENIIEQIPGPYGQDGVPADDKIVYLHYFINGCNWYITERDNWGVQYQMFGYANLGDDEMAEWGYVGVPELEESRVELNLFWKPCRFGDIGKEDNNDELSEASSCSSCGIGMFGNKPLCYRCEEEKNRRSTITLPDTCSVEPVKGTVIQVEDKLLQVEQVNGDGTVTVVEPDIKAGKEADVMSAYLAIRDTFVELEKEQEKW